MKWLATLLLVALPLSGMADEPPTTTTQDQVLASAVDTLATCQDTLEDAVEYIVKIAATVRDCESRLAKTETERARVQKEFEEALRREDEILREAQKLSEWLAQLHQVKAELSAQVAELEKALEAERAERAKYAGTEELDAYLPSTALARLGTVRVPVTRNTFGEVTSVTLSSDVCGGAPLRCKGKAFGSDAEYVNAFNQANPGMVQGNMYRRGEWNIPVRKANQATHAVSEAHGHEAVAKVATLDVEAIKPLSTPTAVAPRGEKPAKNGETSRAKPVASTTTLKADTRKQDLREWAREECAKSPSCAKQLTTNAKTASPVQPVTNKPVEMPATNPVAQNTSAKPVVAKTIPEAVALARAGKALSPDSIVGKCDSNPITDTSKCNLAMRSDGKMHRVSGTDARALLTATQGKKTSS